MKGGNDNDTLAHPDNQKLQKGTSDKYSPVDNGRRCTDFLFLLLLILAWLAMTGIGLASSGFIENESIKKGDPNRLVNGKRGHCAIFIFVYNAHPYMQLRKISCAFKRKRHGLPRKHLWNFKLCYFERR